MHQLLQMLKDDHNITKGKVLSKLQNNELGMKLLVLVLPTLAVLVDGRPIASGMPLHVYKLLGGHALVFLHMLCARPRRRPRCST